MRSNLFLDLMHLALCFQVNQARTYCFRHSPGLDANGKSYKDLEEHFVANWDEVVSLVPSRVALFEAFLLCCHASRVASAVPQEVAVAYVDGSLKIYGARAKKGHWLNSHTSRSSLYFGRCGTAAGAKGPSIYFVDNKTAPTGPLGRKHQASSTIHAA